MIFQSEASLRSAWIDQALSSPFTTTDGKPIEVLRAGELNTDGGPDFISAHIRIGGTLYHGAVELHLDAASWREHRHHLDPHYNGVILHVACRNTRPATVATTVRGRPIPLMLVAPDDTLPVPTKPKSVLPCSDLVGQIDPGVLAHWLERLSHKRLELKTRRCLQRYDEPARIEQHCLSGVEPLCWPQLLYETMAECLGYSKNSSPMRALAESVTLATLKKFDDAVSVDALLFGAAGLLPSSRGLRIADARREVRTLRRRWKELRPSFRSPILHEAEWLFFRLRPHNFPTSRIHLLGMLVREFFLKGGFEELVTIINEILKPSEHTQ